MDGYYSAELEKLHGDRAPYFLRWYHANPMAITSNRRDELKKLHRIMYKCISFMADHYERFVPEYMPLSDAEMELLAIQANYPYRAGAYRPDYILSKDGRILLCEITSRFFAHGIFSSFFAECAAERFMERFPGKKNETEFEAMLQYMAERTTERNKISVLKSADKTGEIQLYVPFYQQFGKQVSVIEMQNVEENRGQWENNCVISALNQKDIISFSQDTVRALIDAGMINDLRTILLVHDKRFMSLWYEDTFTDCCLTSSETTFLREHTIPTWLYGSHEEIWEDLWKNGDIRDMILQPFIRQRTFPTIWEGQHFDDYICGMMLCVDDRYFESGMFRASSLPVSNVGDDRKICPLYTDDVELLRLCNVL